MRDQPSAHVNQRHRAALLTTGNTLAAGRRVLLVEDNFYIADAMASVLRKHDAEVIGPAATVKSALALIAVAERIDGGVLDVNLRGEMVYPVADALRTKGVRFLFLTGYETAIVMPSYADEPRLQKPVTIERLIKALFG